MVTVDALLAARGDVRQALRLPGGPVDWSDREQWRRLEVLRDLRFDDFRVSEVDVGLNFVSCRFADCSFKGLRVDNHFWGAADTWERCVFEECDMTGMIAPMNSFQGCRFDRLMLRNFKPYQTLFAGTEFANCTIEGLRAQTIRNSQMVNSDITGSSGQLLFRECSFVAVDFRQCYFQDVAFERCIWDKTSAHDCSFDGIISDTTWWQAQRLDPFTAFLSKALALIRQKCGPESAVHREFENYVIDYGAGRTADRDFSACLYNNRVPYAETQKVIKELRKLVALHPF